MVSKKEVVPAFEKPDYDYGNHSPIEVIRLMPHPGGAVVDPHASLDHDIKPEAPFTEAELAAKVSEVVENYHLIYDPAPEGVDKHFGITIANQEVLKEGNSALFIFSTDGSSLFDEKGNPNNEGNALETAYWALAYPDRAIIFAESPGNGNSSDLDEEEYQRAAKDGRLIERVSDHSGKAVGYKAFETLQALARALEAEGLSVSHISANASGAHYSTALATALPQDSLERAFLYNPTNISDRNVLALAAARGVEILRQGKYQKASHDPLRLTAERKEMALRIMSSAPKRKVDQVRASTHNPRKMWRQQKMFARGNRHGFAAALQAVAAQLQHQNLRQTFVFPEFASQYKRPEDFIEFTEKVARLGGKIIEMSDLESLQIPLGQYGHSHYPTVRQTLESYAFNRE